MSTENKKRGRPIGSCSANPASEKLPPIRVTKEQLENYRSAAKKCDKTLSGWVKSVLDREAG